MITPSEVAMNSIKYELSKWTDINLHSVTLLLEIAKDT